MSVDIHSSVYLEFYNKDYKIEYGRKVTVTRVKNNLIKEVKISFIHLGTLKFHLQQIFNCKFCHLKRSGATAIQLKSLYGKKNLQFSHFLKISINSLLVYTTKFLK